MTTLENVNWDGRIRAVGCRPSETARAIPAVRVRYAPKHTIKPIVLAELAKRRQWSARSLKLAIAAAIERHTISGRDCAAVLGLEESVLSRSLCWELDVINISYVAEKLGYTARGPADMPTFMLREGPPKKFETVHRDQVLDMLRKAVRAAGSKHEYALRGGGVGMGTSGLAAAVRGQAEIPARFLEPIGIARRNGAFVREVQS